MDPNLLQNLALVLCVAAVVTVMFRWLHQPVVLGYLLAGTIVSPHVPIPLFADLHSIHTLSELGVILVMFSIGLEFSVSRVARVLPTAGLTGLVQITAMIWLGYTIGGLFGWTWRESLFAGAMISISSTMIVARAFAAQGVDSKLTEIVFGVLVVEDLAAVMLIAILTTVAGGAGMPVAVVAEAGGKLLAFLAALTIIGFLIVPRAIRAVARLQSSETLLVASVGLCFGFALLAHKLDYSVALGAFVAGSLVAESGHRKEIEHLVAPLRDLFAAIFFVSVGMMVDPAMVAKHWAAILVLTAVVLMGQLTFVTLGTFLSTGDVRTSVRAGMSLAQIGEFSFIIAGVGVSAGAIGPFLYPVAVAVAVITTFTTPWMVARSNRAAVFVEERLPRPLQTFTALYGSWIESLRSRRRARTVGTGVRRLAFVLILDVSAIAGVVIGASVSKPYLVSVLSKELALPALVIDLMVIATALVLLVPLAISVLRCVRGLGNALAAVVMPAAGAGRLDLGAAPRRALVTALQLGVVIAAGVPLMSLTQPFLPPFVGTAVLAVVLCALGISFWRSTANLEGHVRAGAELVVEMLSRQRGADEPEPPPLPSLLPGLGPLTTVPVPGDSPVVGKSLAEIHLRGHTGASVLAIHRDGAGVVAPTAEEVLRAGDLLALVGSTESIERAASLLATGSLAPASAPDPTGNANERVATVDAHLTELERRSTPTSRNEQSAVAEIDSTTLARAQSDDGSS